MNTKYIKAFRASMLVLLGLFACGCNSHTDMKQLIRHHFNTLNRHDVNELLRDYDIKVESTSPSWEGIHNGVAAQKASYTNSFKSMPNLRYDVGNIYYSGDSVATIEYTTSGTLSHPEGDTPAYMLDRKFILNNCLILKIKDGKIVKEDLYFDQISFLRQMGFFDQQ